MNNYWIPEWNYLEFPEYQAHDQTWTANQTNVDYDMVKLIYCIKRVYCIKQLIQPN